MSTHSPYDPAIMAIARRWEPALYAEIAPDGPVRFAGDLRTPCVETADGSRHCVPGAFLIGNWQSGMKRFGAAVAMHPDVAAPKGGSAPSACFGHWKDDAGGRAWLHKLGGAKLASDFDPARQMLFAADCVAQMAFYPGFAGRYHKYWEAAYWPCKAEKIKPSQREYYETTQWTVCKPRALAAHDAAVSWPKDATTRAGGSAPRAVTPPYLMAQFYGKRAKLLVLLRDPTTRLRTAFHGHVHYPKHFGQGEAGFERYAVETIDAWKACAAEHSAWRCAVHFEQLGARESAVFFHCDQLIRGMYSIFLKDWVAAFPSNVLAVRAEDFFESTSRLAVLQRAWRHLGVRELSSEDETVRKLLSQDPRSTAEWETKRGGASSQQTLSLLRSFYAPFNTELRDILRRDGASCSGDECDAFLWTEPLPLRDLEAGA